MFQAFLRAIARRRLFHATSRSSRKRNQESLLGHNIQPLEQRLLMTTNVEFSVFTQNAQLRASSPTEVVPAAFAALRPDLAAVIYAAYEKTIQNTGSDNEERADLLLERINQFDIVALQEDFDEQQQDQFAAGAAEQGYAYLQGPGKDSINLLLDRLHWGSNSGLSLFVREGLAGQQEFAHEKVAFDEEGFSEDLGNIADFSFDVALDWAANKGFTQTVVQIGESADEYVYVINTHLHAKDRDVRRTQFQELLTFVKNHTDAEHPILILGDLNISEDPAVGSEYSDMMLALNQLQPITSDPILPPIDIVRQYHSDDPDLDADDFNTLDSRRNLLSLAWGGIPGEDDHAHRVDQILVRQGTDYRILVDDVTLEDDPAATSYLTNFLESLESDLPYTEQDDKLRQFLADHPDIMPYLSDHFGVSAQLRLVSYPHLGSMANGRLTLHLDQEADDHFVITAGEMPGEVVVTSYARNTPYSETFTGVTHIQGNAGGGNDSIRVDALVTAALGLDVADRLEHGWFLELDGGEGNDILEAGSGHAVLWGGLGNDTLIATATVAAKLYGEGNDDTLIGGAGDDILDGGTGVDTLDGMARNDTLRGGAGSFTDTLYGGDGDDRLEAGDGLTNVFVNGQRQVNVLLGGEGNDLLLGGNGDDRLDGGRGDDGLYGFEAIDELFGRDGADMLFGGLDNDHLQGGLGNDKLYGDDETGLLAGDDVLLGDAGIDELFGGLGADSLFGGEGDDLLLGGHGDDFLQGNAGSDMLHGQGGNDRIAFSVDLNDPSENDVLTGGTDTDVIEIQGTEEADHLSVRPVDVEAGRFAVERRDVNSGVVTASYEFTLPSFEAEIEELQISGLGGNDIIELAGRYLVARLRIDGGNGNDTITGSDGNDLIYGGADNGGDTIFAGKGEDEIYGGGGTDTIYGGDDSDQVHGGAGDDILFGGNGFDVIIGGAGHDRLEAGDDLLGDILFGDGQAANAEDGNDVILGGEGVDIVFGGGGNDYIEGRGLGDSLHGEAGNDTIIGGTGRDYIDGGDQDDILYANSTNPLEEFVEPDIHRLEEIQRELTARLVQIDGPVIPLPDNSTVDIYGLLEANADQQAEIRRELDRLEKTDPLRGALETRLHELIAEDLRLRRERAAISAAKIDLDPYQDLFTDVLIGQGGNDHLYGSVHVDRLIGGSGSDVIYQSAGNDFLIGGTDTIEANTSIDDSSEDEYRLLGTNDGDEIVFQLENIDGGLATVARVNDQEAILASRLGIEIAGVDALGGDDHIVVNFSDNAGVLSIRAIGGSGNDELDATGSQTAVYLVGGDGNDTLIGGLSDLDRFDGGQGRDTLIENVAGTVELTDTALYRGGIVESLREIDLVELRGSEQDDSISANSSRGTFHGDVIFHGNGGNDVLVGSVGNDILNGGAGSDRIAGGLGVNVIDAGSDASVDTLIEELDVHFKLYDTILYLTGGESTLQGIDRAEITGGASYNKINAQYFSGQTVLRGEGGNDNLIGSNLSSDTLYGGEGDDLLNGLGNHDTLDGGIGDDRLYGGEGNDVLIGDLGSDSLYGENGHDVIYGHRNGQAGEYGTNRLSGGNGDDHLQGAKGFGTDYLWEMPVTTGFTRPR